MRIGQLWRFRGLTRDSIYVCIVELEFEEKRTGGIFQAFAEYGLGGQPIFRASLGLTPAFVWRG